MSLNVEHFAPQDSPFARLDPRWKLATIVVVMGFVAALRSPWAVLLSLMFALLLSFVARVPGQWMRVRVGLVFFSLLPFLLLLPLTVDRGGPAFRFMGLQASWAGAIAAFCIAGKTISLLIFALIVLASSPLSVTLHAVQRLRVPALLTHLAMMSYRYIFLLMDELSRLRIAVRLRGFRNRANRQSYRTIGRLTGTLIIRGAERAERVAQAMRCRGFHGQFRDLHAFQTRAADVIASFALIGIFAALLACDLFWL